MALIDTVKTLCQRLAPLGWASLLKRHGLDITKANLGAELAKILQVDRTVAGFEDFAMEGVRGIEPGNPGRSVLYHALASPRVRVDGAGANLGGYPTPAEIEAVENYVYGVQSPTLAELRARAGAGSSMAVVVFATEYRPANETVHRRHADVCFSRTGLARIGTSPTKYDAAERGYLPFVGNQKPGIRVLPARYSAYIAVQRQGNASSFGPLRFRTQSSDGAAADGDLNFWVPLHKLFPGHECIAGLNIDLTLRAFHVNEKLRRVHLRFGEMGQDGGWREPDISASPFIFHDGIAEFSASANDGAGLLIPVPHPALVEAAQFQGKTLTYRVPEDSETLSSSLLLPGLDDGRGPRKAPEYVHARHRMKADGTIEDLNGRADPQSVIQAGNYRAVHYIDFSGDGFISVESTALSVEIPRRIAAYSMVTAPDFFPSTDQRELSEWTDQAVPSKLRRWLWRVPPDELSNQRLPPNLQIAGSGFIAEDRTATAIVTLPRTGPGAQSGIVQDFSRAHSMLPDAASGTFAPGWDTSRTINDSNVEHLGSFGLGSPFPEDAKLCAALSTFWPSVAPDAARTFEPDKDWPTVAPLTDEEIGITGNNPWDGIRGPRLVPVGNSQRVEYTRLSHADYINTSLAGKITLSLTGQVDLAEYKRRVLVMARTYEAMSRRQLLSGPNTRGRWSVLSFRESTAADAAELAGAQQAAQQMFGSQLAGPLTRVDLYEHGETNGVQGDVTKIRVRILQRVVVYVAALRLCLRLGNTAWRAIDV
jgi:hypothetical protein